MVSLCYMAASGKLHFHHLRHLAERRINAIVPHRTCTLYFFFFFLFHSSNTTAPCQLPDSRAWRGHAWSGSSLAQSSITFTFTTAAQNQSCRCFPGDACWPSTGIWDQFNQTIDGRLIATVPLATPCHAPNYDAVVCNALREEWEDPEVQYVYSPRF